MKAGGGNTTGAGRLQPVSLEHGLGRQIGCLRNKMTSLRSQRLSLSGTPCDQSSGQTRGRPRSNHQGPAYYLHTTEFEGALPFLGGYILHPQRAVLLSALVSSMLARRVRTLQSSK